MKARVVQAGLVSALLAGCPSAPPSSSAVDAGTSPLQATLGEIASGGAAVYSFRFDAPPPGGAFYTLALHLADTTAACARYGAAASNDVEFWFLEVDVNDDAPGAHAISLSQRDGSASPTANVTLLHRKNGAFVEAYDAVAGNVVVDVNPTPDEAKSGKSLEGHLEADFPTHALFEVECRGGAPTDGGPMFEECQCRDSSGVSSTCTPVNHENCCHDPNSPTFRVSAAFHATHCSAMCRWVAGLSTDYCYQYFGQ